MAGLVCLLLASPFVLKFNLTQNNCRTQIKLQMKEKVLMAYDFSGSLKKAAVKSGFQNSLKDKPVSLPVMVGLVIQGLFALIGVVFLILTIIAGLRWMWSGGDEETISAAKKSIKNAIIGSIIVWGAYAITYYVMKALFG